MKKQKNSTPHSALHVLRGAISILAGLIAFAANSAWSGGDRLIPDYHARSKVWLVSSDGKVQPVFPPPGKSASKKTEITQVFISPQQRKIAYVQDHDLWLYDIGSGKASRLTNVGKPYTKTWASVEAFIKHWSPDEKEILYAVVGGDTEDPEGNEPDLKARPAPYGMHIFDLEAGQSKAVQFPADFGEPEAWLKSGDFLFLAKNKILRYDPKTKNATPISTTQYPLNQINVSHDGVLLLATTDPTTRMRSSLLVKYDLKTGGMTPLTQAGKWAEFQWPTFSPTGARIAFFHYLGLSATRRPIVELVIDNKAIYTFEGNKRFFWLDESTVALAVANNRAMELIVLDADSGIIKAKHHWE